MSMKRAGFTLMELMTVVLIFSLILVATLSVLTMGRKTWYIGNTQLDVQQDARNAMNRMLIDLLEASAIDQSTFINDVSNNFIRFTLNGQPVEFAVSAGQLQKTAAGATLPLANNIKNIEFTLLGGNVVYVTLSTEKQATFGPLVEVVLNSQVALRN